MSETVILSKATARQRPQSKESMMSPATHTSAPGSPVCDGVEKMSAKGKKAATPLVMVKELVRDNSRLVKDLMALLAIREATKDTGGAPLTDEGIADGEISCVALKNRPGNDGDRMIPLRAVGSAGNRATAVAAAVASLLHHTATKEFSSLAGEIIAIADDTRTGDGCERRTMVEANGEPGKNGTNTNDDGMMPTMLHADAAAAEADTTEAITSDEPCTMQPTKYETPEEEYGRRVPEKRSAVKTDATKGEKVYKPTISPAAGSPSGPVPVLLRVPRAATPMPAFSLANVSQQCECCIPAAATRQSPELTLEQKLDKLLDSVVKIKADMHHRIDRLGRRVEQIHLDVQLNIDSTDRALLRNDLLLIGIPQREREDLQQCFLRVCRALEYDEQDIPQVYIRRQRVARRRTGQSQAALPQRGSARDRQNEQPAPIVVEFMFKTLRDQFYRAYQAKRVLRLSDVGFASERRFFVNEVLTRYNQKLMGEAVRRKRTGLLHSVYTADGIVYVQRVAGEKGIKVTSFASMN